MTVLCLAGLTVREGAYTRRHICNLEDAHAEQLHRCDHGDDDEPSFEWCAS